MLCLQCGQLIPPERLEALPLTTVCIVCSKVAKYTEETEGIIDGADPHDLISMFQGE